MARRPADQTVNRDDILNAAAKVLQRKGYEAATMKDIAAGVNLTAASLYHHFENKDMLVLAVLETGLELVISQLESIAEAHKSCTQKLREMIAVHVVGLTENTAVGAALVFEMHTLPDMEGCADFTQRRNAFSARRNYFEELFREVVRDGINGGEFRPVDVAIFTKTLLGAHNGVGIWYKDGGRLNGQQIAQLMADTFLRSLKPDHP